MNPKSLLERLEPGKVRGGPYVCGNNFTLKQDE